MNFAAQIQGERGSGNITSGRRGNMRATIQQGGITTAVAQTADGQWVDIADGLLCLCGHEFGEYVRRALAEPFPYSSSDPAAREVTQLWPGRRLRLLRGDAAGEWETDWRVAKWRQWNSGPMDSGTKWSVVIHRGCSAEETLAAEDAKQSQQERRKKLASGAEPEPEPESSEEDDEAFYDAREPAQLPNNAHVMIAGLVGAPQHNRCVGQVKGFSASKGRYLVRYVAADGDAVDVNVKPGNLFLCELHRLCRVNVEGGGTFGRPWSCTAADYEAPDAATKLISFRWLEAAEPVLEPFEGVSCPKCRAIEVRFQKSCSLLFALATADLRLDASHHALDTPRPMRRSCTRASARFVWMRRPHA